MVEPKVVCDTCHQYVPMSRATPFVLRREWYHECDECEAKRLVKEARRKEGAA